MKVSTQAVLRHSLANFYSENQAKGKKYTYDRFKGLGLSKAGNLIRRIKASAKKIDLNLITDMMDKVKPRCHQANEHGLFSLLK